jgi:nitrite reductase/ring-hydroxylating ferredoxin subunit
VITGDRRSRRLRRYVRDLLRGRRPRSFRVDPDEAAQIAVAIDLRAARLGASAPDEYFLARLHHGLAAAADSLPLSAAAADPLRRRASRRQVVVAATTSAAAVVGVATGIALDRTLTRPDETATGTATLTPNNGVWHTVALSEDLPNNDVRPFNVGTVIGFVRRSDGQVHAVSGVCSHQGCHLRFESRSRELQCPCHNAAFALDGVILRHQLPAPPPTLPAISTREIHGEIQVLAPAD